jgi:hypothetical protein
VRRFPGKAFKRNGLHKVLRDASEAEPLWPLLKRVLVGSIRQSDLSEQLPFPIAGVVVLVLAGTT